MNPIASRFSVLMGTASLLTMANAAAVQAQNQVGTIAQANPEEVPEQVLVTGSLIRGAAAVGVPVTNLSLQDVNTAGVSLTGDLLRDVPAIYTLSDSNAFNNGGALVRLVRVNIHDLDSGLAPRSLMMVDGVRYPIQGDHFDSRDPSIIPAIALDRMDVLVDGASATYGSDAISGVINVILKRGYDGAITQLNFISSDGGRRTYTASQLWGRTWDGGDLTLSYEWSDSSAELGSAHSKFTMNFAPWGFDNAIPLGSSLPGTISTGAPVNTSGTKFSANAGNNCTNCYAIPAGSGGDFQSSLNNGLGPLAPSSAIGVINWSTLTAAANSGVNGTRNEFDPLTIAWEAAAQQRNAATMTVDQRLFPNVSFYGEGFYSNRRAEELEPSVTRPDNTDILSAISVPTSNPYYPTGAPSGLRVGYNLAIETPPFIDGSEISARYLGGFNLDLPFAWHGNIYYSMTRDSNNVDARNIANVNAVSAALGWTINATPPSGTMPGIATWTRPATVPYLNLFCDPHVYQCNSPATLSYIAAFEIENESDVIREAGANFDGALFDLPAGAVKAAIGGNFRSEEFTNTTLTNSGSPTLIASPLVSSDPFQVWAGFAQLNVPIFGDNFNVPLARKLELEVSWRHDQYTGSLEGGTSNPKVGFTWLISQDAGLSLRGSWGSAFRFATPGEYAPDYISRINAYNLPANLQVTAAPMVVACGPGNSSPPAGSGGAKLYATFGTSICNQGVGGLAVGGGPLPELRPNGFNGGVNLRPESSNNNVLGIEFAPTSFLNGLDMQASFWSVKISDILGGPPMLLNNAQAGFSFIVPSDLAGLPGGAGCATANANPTQCALFEKMVAAVLANPHNGAAQAAAQTLVYWIDDGSTYNYGSQLSQGIDWNASYDWDMGDLGAGNVGIVGTYYLHNYVEAPGQPIIDSWHTTLTTIGGLPIRGVESLPRMSYRARLGWSNGPWSVVGFMNYESHYFGGSSPPNVNFLCQSAGGSLPGGTFPCAITGFTGYTPSVYLFDLSLGYNTGDTPANDYLKRVGIQLVVRNIMDRHPAFQYNPGVNGHTPSAYDQNEGDDGRILTLILTKIW